MASAAHESGYVGEAWGTLKGDRTRAMHGLFMGLRYALYKNVATQLYLAQMNANRLFVAPLSPPASEKSPVALGSSAGNQGN